MPPGMDARGEHPARRGQRAREHVLAIRGVNGPHPGGRVGGGRGQHRHRRAGVRRPPDPRGARPWPVGRRAGAHQARAVRVHAGDHNRDLPDACPGPRGPHRRTCGAGARAGSAQPVADRGRRSPVLPLATPEPHARGPIPADHREVPVAAATADHIRPARPRGRADGRARDRRDQCTDRPAAALPGLICIKSVLAGGRHRIGINTLQTVGVGALLGAPTSSEGLA